MLTVPYYVELCLLSYLRHPILNPFHCIQCPAVCLESWVGFWRCGILSWTRFSRQSFLQSCMSRHLRLWWHSKLEWTSPPARLETWKASQPKKGGDSGHEPAQQVHVISANQRRSEEIQHIVRILPESHCGPTQTYDKCFSNKWWLINRCACAAFEISATCFNLWCITCSLNNSQLHRKCRLFGTWFSSSLDIM